MMRKNLDSEITVGAAWPYDEGDCRWSVIEYCTEEVRRQGHNVTKLDGIERVGWMLNAWSYALREKSRAITLHGIEGLGRLVELDKNTHGFRTVSVYVGREPMPHWSTVVPSLQILLERQIEMKPLEFYRAFLEIHPFVDGNGRVGKVLLNWKNGTLLNPIFPPNDFWGVLLRNP